MHQWTGEAKRGTARASTIALVASSMLAAVAAVSGSIGCGRGPTYLPSATRGAVAAPGARGGGPPDPIVTPLGSQVAVEVGSALSTLVEASCAAERRCGRLGIGRRFAEEASCKRGIEQQTRARLNATVCDTGYVDHLALRECADAIQYAACNAEDDPFDGACRPDTLCAR